MDVAIPPDLLSLSRSNPSPILHAGVAARPGDIAWISTGRGVRRTADPSAVSGVAAAPSTEPVPRSHAHLRAAFHLPGPAFVLDGVVPESRGRDRSPAG